MVASRTCTPTISTHYDVRGDISAIGELDARPTAIHAGNVAAKPYVCTTSDSFFNQYSSVVCTMNDTVAFISAYSFLFTEDNTDYQAYPNCLTAHAEPGLVAMGSPSMYREYGLLSNAIARPSLTSLLITPSWDMTRAPLGGI